MTAMNAILELVWVYREIDRGAKADAVVLLVTVAVVHGAIAFGAFQAPTFQEMAYVVECWPY